MVTAILLSGGAGTRLASDIPKQYIRIGGRMIVTYSLETLITHPLVDEVCIVAESAWYERILCELAGKGIAADKLMGCAEPGYNRQESILNGLETVIAKRNGGAEPLTPSDQVLIHDAARPILTGNRSVHACMHLRNTRGRCRFCL